MSNTSSIKSEVKLQSGTTPLSSASSSAMSSTSTTLPAMSSTASHTSTLSPAAAPPALDDVTVKPLSEDDIDAIRNKISKLDTANLTKVTDLFVKYHQHLNNVIHLVRKQSSDEDDIVEIERVKRLMGLCPTDELFYRTKDKVWAARNKILNKDLAWFMNRNYSQLIKKDSKQVMIETLIGLVKEKSSELTPEELDNYWKKGFELLIVIGAYKKIVGEV